MPEQFQMAESTFAQSLMAGQETAGTILTANQAKFCHKCGNALANNDHQGPAIFCHRCGTQAAHVPPSTPIQMPQPAEDHNTQLCSASSSISTPYGSVSTPSRKRSLAYSSSDFQYGTPPKTGCNYKGDCISPNSIKNESHSSSFDGYTDNDFIDITDSLYVEQQAIEKDQKQSFSTLNAAELNIAGSSQYQVGPGTLNASELLTDDISISMNMYLGGQSNPDQQEPSGTFGGTFKSEDDCSQYISPVEMLPLQTVANVVEKHVETDEFGDT